jgi:hypothetical protein
MRRQARRSTPASAVFNGNAKRGLYVESRKESAMSNPLSNPDGMGQTDWIEDLTLEDFPTTAPIEQLIGTDECSYCHLLTECLSLPNDGDTERAACLHCVARAFDAVIGPRLRLCSCGNAAECVSGQNFQQVVCRRCGRRGPLAPADDDLAITLWNNDHRTDDVPVELFPGAPERIYLHRDTQGLWRRTAFGNLPDTVTYVPEELK